MKCKYCNGTGEHINDANRMTTCEFCGGKGVIEPLTNEEWFCGLSTEEKAKFLRKIYCDGRDDYVGEWYEQEEEDFLQWLKEKHNEMSNV